MKITDAQAAIWEAEFMLQDDTRKLILDLDRSMALFYLKKAFDALTYRENLIASLKESRRRNEWPTYLNVDGTFSYERPA